MSETLLALLVPREAGNGEAAMRRVWKKALLKTTGYQAVQVGSQGDAWDVAMKTVDAIEQADGLLVVAGAEHLPFEQGVITAMAHAIREGKPVFSQHPMERALYPGFDPGFDPALVQHVGNRPSLIREALERVAAAAGTEVPN